MNKKIYLKIFAIVAMSVILELGICVNKAFAQNVLSEENTSQNSIAEQSTEIIKKDINGLKNNINTSIHTYTGEKRTPSVKLYDENYKLVVDRDYTVTYKNNVKIGKAEIIIKGINNYTGTITKYFYISPKKEKITSVMFNSKFTKAIITWEKDSKVTGYALYMSESKDGEYKKIKHITSKKITSYTKKGLDPNKMYYFKIRGFKTVKDKNIYSKSYSKAKSNTGLIAEVSLNSPTSGANRNQNLKLASKKINGKVLKQGETFNWFKVVGAATKKNGFKEAIVFANKKHALGYGGGVCQVSTTLYQASLKAGLKIVERHQHSLPVSYTKKGKDATVSYGVQNLKIKNNKKYSIKIVMFAKKGKTTCQLYRVED